MPGRDKQEVTREAGPHKSQGLPSDISSRLIGRLKKKGSVVDTLMCSAVTLALKGPLK